ncbi:P-loop NTPase fold protein [Mycoplasmatota bacterium WC30]
MEKESKRHMSDYTFKDDDKLSRLDFCTNITEKLFKVKTDGATVIALNSAWGTGKTLLCKMWGNAINNNEIGSGVYRAIYYSAWNNDDWFEALTPIVYELASDRGKVEQVSQILETINKTSVKDVFKFFGNLLVEILSKQGIPTESIKTFAKSIKETENMSELDLGLKVSDDFKNYLEAKAKLKEYLRNIDSKKIVFFVDELDRCKPTFAIETLEIIKHLFDLDNFIFILSLDLSQLIKSIETCYGKGIDSTKYLAKFIDFRIDIPNINSSAMTDFVKGNTANINIDSANKQILNDAISSFYTKNNFELRDVILSVKMVESFIGVYYPKNFDNKLIEIICYSFLILIKYMSIDNYKSILQNGSLTISREKVYIVVDKKEIYNIELKRDSRLINLLNETLSVDFSNDFKKHFNCINFKREKNSEIQAIYKRQNSYYADVCNISATRYYVHCNTILGLSTNEIYECFTNSQTIGETVMNKLEYFNKIIE